MARKLSDEFKEVGLKLIDAGEQLEPCQDVTSCTIPIGRGQYLTFNIVRLRWELADLRAG